jgi:hypothetical protein
MPARDRSDRDHPKAAIWLSPVSRNAKARSTTLFCFPFDEVPPFSMRLTQAHVGQLTTSLVSLEMPPLKQIGIFAMFEVEGENSQFFKLS